MIRDCCPSTHLVRLLAPPKTGLAVRKIGDYPAKKLFARRASERPRGGFLRIHSMIFMVRV
jgi:hypothetical protein